MAAASIRQVSSTADVMDETVLREGDRMRMTVSFARALIEQHASNALVTVEVRRILPEPDGTKVLIIGHVEARCAK